MNIIFGDAVKELPEHYIVLELDTFRIPDSDKTHSAYCIIEKLALHEFPLVEAQKKIHQDLLTAYRDQNWQYCQDAIQGLLGKWGGEMDTYYVDLLKRVLEYKANPPGADWNGTRIRI
jgi:adenylate cyclase